MWHYSTFFDASVDACVITKENEGPKSKWLARNPNHLTLCKMQSATSSTTAFLEKIHSLAPNNPTILVVSPADDGPLLCSTLWIVSSARTVELYTDGEYTGTFRGETLEENNQDAGAAASGPPLFAIKINQESLPRNSRELFVKFFIPKKPVAFQDSLDLHWLIVQAGLLSLNATSSVSGLTGKHSINFTGQESSFMSENQDITGPRLGTSDSTRSASITSRISTPSPLHLSSPRCGSAGSSPLPPQMAALASTFASSSSVDMERVREMLSQVQLEGLSQKAREHLGAMEMQSKLMRERALAMTLAAAAAHRLPPSSVGSASPGLVSAGSVSADSTTASTSSVTSIIALAPTPATPDHLSISPPTSALAAVEPTSDGALLSFSTPYSCSVASTPVPAADPASGSTLSLLPSYTAADVTAAHGATAMPTTTTLTFVTRAELDQTADQILSRIDETMHALEDRIMNSIEEGLSKMEERIMEKLLLQKRTETERINF
ncbi:hypothetical protein BGZ83_007349 [Gryganskiella cystojenkinii]|nr:hypothetical protein BGZ83_007349 [Gryganskiella cystojenkinii]